jgi:hypothetical protein
MTLLRKGTCKTVPYPPGFYLCVHCVICGKKRKSTRSRMFPKISTLRARSQRFETTPETSFRPPPAPHSSLPISPSYGSLRLCVRQPRPTCTLRGGHSPTGQPPTRKNADPPLKRLSARRRATQLSPFPAFLCAFFAGVKSLPLVVAMRAKARRDNLQPAKARPASAFKRHSPASGATQAPRFSAFLCFLCVRQIPPLMYVARRAAARRGEPPTRKNCSPSRFCVVLNKNNRVFPKERGVLTVGKYAKPGF